MEKGEKKGISKKEAIDINKALEKYLELRMTFERELILIDRKSKVLLAVVAMLSIAAVVAIVLGF